MQIQQRREPAPSPWSSVTGAPEAVDVVVVSAEQADWQHARGLALLGWVRDDAAFIAGRIATFAHARARPRTSPD